MRPTTPIFCVLLALLGCGCAVAHRDWTAHDLQDSPASTHPSNNSHATTVRVTTGSQGEITSVVIVKASGSPAADRAIVEHIKAHWHGPPNISRETDLYHDI